jgi:hypothetical protein
MRNIFVIASIFFFCQIAEAQVRGLLDKGKETARSVSRGEQGDIAAGLKEALNEGVKSAVDQLSGTDGFFESPYRILIPEDAQQVIDRVKRVPGFEDVESKLIKQMNDAASLAAQKATPIFVNAIRQMSFADARNILAGDNNAATTYLQGTSRQPLYNEFMPIIQASLDAVNARTYWTTVVEAYNRIPMVRRMNPQLDDHVNNKALDGLFGLIAVKEEGIRTDVNQQTSELLKRVFGGK